MVNPGGTTHVSHECHSHSVRETLLCYLRASSIYLMAVFITSLAVSRVLAPEKCEFDTCAFSRSMGIVHLLGIAKFYFLTIQVQP